MPPALFKPVPVRQEIGGFLLKTEVFVGRETANTFEAYLEVPCGFRYRGERLPEVPVEGLPFVSDSWYLNRREAALVLRMRNSAFWFRDSLVEPYVLWCYRWYWDEVEMMEDEDRKLPLKSVRRLLDVLLNEEPTFATGEEIVKLHMDVDVVAGWERTFRHKRRHLVWLFQTALRLGEEVVYSTM